MPLPPVFRASMRKNAWAAISARWFVQWRIASRWSEWKIICHAKLGKTWSMGILIKNGTVVSADQTLASDVLIEAETIKEVRPGIPVEPGHQVLDAAGMLLLPG